MIDRGIGHIPSPGLGPIAVARAGAGFRCQQCDKSIARRAFAISNRIPIKRRPRERKLSGAAIELILLNRTTRFLSLAIRRCRAIWVLTGPLRVASPNLAVSFGCRLFASCVPRGGAGQRPLGLLAKPT